MINIVVPMAGAGSRFTRAGYRVPKYLIEVNGKSLLEYSLMGLPLEKAKKVYFVTLDEHANDYDLQTTIAGLLGSTLFQIVRIPAKTGGQAETVMACKEQINNNNDLIIFNIDTFYQSSSQFSLLADSRRKHDGFLGAFKAEGTQWSFAKTDPDGFVVETAEKVRISDNALTGLYHFSQGSDFVAACSHFMASNTRFANEYYVAPMYNFLIKRGRRYVLDHVDRFVPLGTPEDIADAKGLPICTA